jgi:catechol 2,3-dioxygenase-like lactoylglutathione lyase family enzyme
MNAKIRHITLLVRSQDEALRFYTEKLGFIVQEDSLTESGKRWLTIIPHAGSPCGMLLAQAKGDEQESVVGNQTGGKVLLVLHTDDFDADYDRIIKNGIRIDRGPVKEQWGRVVVFLDLYGNKLDLVEVSG